jgi:hypothetical protein
MKSIDKREELLAAAAAGLGLVAQGLVMVSDATQHAAVALAKVAKSLEEQQAETPETPGGPGTASPGPSGSTGPTGPYDTPSSPWGQPPTV